MDLRYAVGWIKTFLKIRKNIQIVKNYFVFLLNMA